VFNEADAESLRVYDADAKVALKAEVAAEAAEAAADAKVALDGILAPGARDADAG
jgi:hypothetical protein